MADDAPTSMPLPAATAAAGRTIRPIKIQSGDFRSGLKTFFSYGGPRTGKTRWLGSWPRPLIIADATERGWTTLETMPPEGFYEPDFTPEVWPVENADQVIEAIRDAKPLIDRGDFLTLGFDSITFYADTWINTMKRRWAERNPGKAVDTRAIYGGLADHMQDLRIQLHKWPCNVGWLALEVAPSAEQPRGGPMLPGKTREKFPAGCDHIFLHRSYTFPNPETNVPEPYFEMHAGPFGAWLIGGRDSGQLPPSIFNPTYREFAELLQLANPLEAHARMIEQLKKQPNLQPAAAAAPQRPVTTTVRRTISAPKK